MNKYKKLLTLSLAIVLCLSLCGCVDLEGARASHAVWQEDGSILWNGAVYRELENTSSMEELDFSYSYITVYVTQPDVPVLLSDVFGDAYDVCADGTILNYYDYRTGENGWYCREDVYDEMVATLQNGVKLNTYCYYYWDSNKQMSVPYYLTEEQANTMHRILATVDPVFDNELYYESMIDELYLYVGDSAHLFEQEAEKRLYITESCYCIESFDCIYVVPVEYNQIFAEIWKAYNESMYVMEVPPSIVI